MATGNTRVRGVTVRLVALSSALRGHERLLWALVLVTLFADVALTRYGLDSAARVAERNPIAAVLYIHYGLAGLLALKGGVLVVAVSSWVILPVWAARFVPLLLLVPWGVAVAVNVVVLLVV